MVYNGGHVLLIVMITAGLILSFGGGYYMSRNIENSDLQKTNVELQESLEKIKKALPGLKEIRSFEGTVRSVGENTITIEVAPSPNPFDEWPVIREVTITSETKILHRGVKSPDILQKEFETHKKVLDVFFEEEIPVNYIKTGWKITVEGGEDIKTKESFKAVRILDDWPFSGLPLNLPGTVSMPATGAPTTMPAITGTPLSTNLPTPPPSIPSGGVVRPSILPTPPPAPLSSPILAPAVPIPSGTPVPGNLPPTPPLSLPSVPPLPSGMPPSVLPTPPL